MSDQRDASYLDTGIDNIVQVLTGSLIVPASSSNSAVVAHNLQDTSFYDGYFNVDGGEVRVPLFGQYNTDNTPALFGARINLAAVMNSTSITLSSTNTDTSSHTLNYVICLFSKSGQLYVDPDITSSTDQIFSSSDNYPKIKQDSYSDIILPSATTVGIFSSITTTIAHDLGYNPLFRVMLEYNGNMYTAEDYINTEFFTSAVSCDNNNLYIQLYNWAAGANQPAKDIRAYYRIYYDN